METGNTKEKLNKSKNKIRTKLEPNKILKPKQNKNWKQFITNKDKDNKLRQMCQ